MLEAVFKQPPTVEALSCVDFQNAKDLKSVHCKLVLTEGVSLCSAHILEEACASLVQFARIGVLFLLAEFFACNAYFFEKGELLLPLRMLVTLGVSLDLSQGHFDPDVLTHTFQDLFLLFCASDG